MGTGISQSSILPSLSTSQQHTPRSGSPTFNDNASIMTGSDTDQVNSAQEFFHSHKRTPHDSQNILTDNLYDKLGSKLIQPRSRYSNVAFQSLVVDPKKKSEDAGLPGLKINRSSNNLTSLNNSSFSSYSNMIGLNPTTNSSTMSVPSTRQRTPISRQGFTLHSNSSSNSIPTRIKEVEEEEARESDYASDKSVDEDHIRKF